MKVAGHEMQIRRVCSGLGITIELYRGDNGIEAVRMVDLPGRGMDRTVNVVHLGVYPNLGGQAAFKVGCIGLDLRDPPPSTAAEAAAVFMSALPDNS